MTAPKNHHYVPQSYLRRFSSDGTQVYVFDKSTRRSFVTNVKNVASETYFHDIPEDQLSKLLEWVQQKFKDSEDLPDIVDAVKGLGTIEERLSQIEGQFVTVIDELVADLERNTAWFKAEPEIKSLSRRATNDVDVIDIVERLAASESIDSEYKPAVAFLVAIQFVRTKEYRDSLKEYLEKSTKAVSEMFLRIMGVDMSGFEVETQVSEEHLKALHLGHMQDIDVISRMVNALMNHMWAFEANETPQPFFISDNPVALVPNKVEPFRHHTGYASEGIIVRMPLSPKYVVAFYERTFFADLERIEGKVLPVDLDNVTYHNSVQINQSYRQIYAPSSDFELAERTCREHPEVCDPNRSRFDVH